MRPDSTLSQSLADECEIDKGQRYNIKYFETRKNAPEALQSAKETFHLRGNAAVTFPPLNKT
jgi:hypothetical protein